MSTPNQPLTGDQIEAAGLTDWRKLGQALHARYHAADFPAATRFVAALAEVGEDGHRPEVRIIGNAVELVVCTTHDGRWVLPQDVELAARITDLAREHDLTPAPHEVRQIELGLDTTAHQGINRFWSAMITGDAGNTIYDSVFDPTGQAPAVWFQESDELATSQRWHLDIWVAPEVADERIAAAVAAGGELLAEFPSFAVLADADGNRSCICSQRGRG